MALDNIHALADALDLTPGALLDAWGGKTSCGPFVLAVKTAEHLVAGDSG